MILSRKNIHAGQTGAGGFKRAQVEALGLQWPVRKGWLSQLIGTEISDEAYERFIAARDRGTGEPAAPPPPKPSREDRLAALEDWAARMQEIIYEHFGRDVPL